MITKGMLKHTSMLGLVNHCFEEICSKNKKRSGERGSPYLTHLLEVKLFPGIPFRRTDEGPEFRILLIQFNHFFEKPLCFITSRMT